MLQPSNLWAPAEAVGVRGHTKQACGCVCVGFSLLVADKCVGNHCCCALEGEWHCVGLGTALGRNVQAVVRRGGRHLRR